MQAPTSVEELPPVIPIFPLGGALLLPRGRLPLNIFEPRYLAMTDEALKGHRLIGMIQPLDRDAESDVPGLHRVGCVGRITQFSETEDGRYLITLTGITRFAVQEELKAVTPYRQVEADYAPFKDDFYPSPEGVDINRSRLLELLRQYLDLHSLEADWEAIDRAGGETLVNSLCMISPFGVSEKQALLEAQSPVERTDVLIALIEMAMAGDDSGAPVQ